MPPKFGKIMCVQDPLTCQLATASCKKDLQTEDVVNADWFPCGLGLQDVLFFATCLLEQLEQSRGFSALDWAKPFDSKTSDFVR